MDNQPPLFHGSLTWNGNEVPNDDQKVEHKRALIVEKIINNGLELGVQLELGEDE